VSIFHYTDSLLRAAVMTLKLCAFGAVAGTAWGLVVGLLRASSFRPLRWLAALYTSVLRGVPILIVLLFTYYGLPLAMPNLRFSAYICGAIGLTLFVGAYVAEAVRGGLESVPTGQTEAAQALGLSNFQRLRLVMLPQAVRVIVPPWIGILLALVKETSLVSVVGLVELTRAGRVVGQESNNTLAAFALVALVYFVICWPIGQFGRWYEHRLAASGLRTVHEPAVSNLLGEDAEVPTGGAA
jgi:polar amino acid transport system permease protein